MRLSDGVWGGASWERAKLDVEEGGMLGRPRNARLTLDSVGPWQEAFIRGLGGPTLHVFGGMPQSACRQL